ncbi:adenylate and guanylate cyclase catalytic domain-containing protein [Obelidium mucronatum]|nr:adenylate and guanylate cyclase catalytic domain-containing protein [Obelidium mucronatum]
MVFSQSAAVNRCRNVKETKLKAQQALAKLADEEVTIYFANLEESRHQLRTQLAEQSAVELRQAAEARDTQVSWERKEQLNKLVDKLTRIKSLLRFQEEAREREIGFKSSIRQKRAAFQDRLARLEQRHAAERNELFMSQQRLAITIDQIHAIELKGIHDRNKQRRMRKENEIQAQQTSMRQQKESEFLRELQLCKARQMGELNDLDINHMEEIEDVAIQQRLEEFELVAKHNIVESELERGLERQKYTLEANHLLDRQKAAKTSLQRMQRKQLQTLAKAQRAAARNREKGLIADNPVIRGDATDQGNGETESNDGMSESEGASSKGGSILSLHEEATGSQELSQRKEAEKNSALNKDTQVLSEAEKELQALLEAGNERIRGVAMHHKKIVTELRQLHRHALHQKAKEQRRKVSDLLKDHEEEIEQIKMDQAQTMKELLDTHLQSEEMRADTAVSQNLLGMMLPAHIIEKLEMGVQPEPEQFSCVSLFFTDIYDFKKLVGQVSPVKILQLLNALYTRFDLVIAQFPELYKVETVSDTYMVVAGLSSSNEKTKEEIADCTIQALKCCAELQRVVASMDFHDIVGDYPVKLRIGIHSGTINAGLIGTKMSRYCLFGDTVNTASRMCTTGEPSKIQVSPQTIQVLGADDQFEFEVRGEIEVKGKGKMRTYWLLN